MSACSTLLAAGDPIDALVYAQNVYAAVDRRMPEARGLASWLTASAMALGLSDAAIPEEWEGTFRSRRNAVPVEDWVKVGEALDAALTTPTRVFGNAGCVLDRRAEPGAATRHGFRPHPGARTSLQVRPAG